MSCSRKYPKSRGRDFDGVWGKGLSGDNPEHWKTFCEAVGLTEEEANEKISDPEIKSLLRNNGEEAIDAGVFGFRRC